LSASTAAHADIPYKAFYLGLYGGGNIVLDDWDLADEDDANLAPDSGVTFGARLGFQFTHWLAIELGLGGLPLTSPMGGSNFALSYTGDALFHPFKGDWVPFIDVGTGFYQNVDGDLGKDFDSHWHWGLGLRGMLTDWMALRVDARHMITDGSEDPKLANNIEITLGLDFFAWREEHEAPPPPDSDGDGIADPDDACPETPGVESAKGCPDKDGDGIADDDDRCPAQPGPVALQGCPDKDGDGIADGDDRCPDKAGPAATKGCPDSDGDGVVDIDDRCPEVKGVPERKGCPVPVVPKEVEEKFSGTLEGIFFQTGSAKILKKSFKVLDEAVAVLKKFPEIKVFIDGHTDDRGKDSDNMKLSQDRAQSVADYLTEKGIAKDRMTPRGFGESKPIGDNKTKSGRAKNRRIEFHVQSQ